MTDTTTINLAAFCTADCYPWMREPVSDGAWLYATGGHVCVRVPTCRPAQVVPDEIRNLRWHDRPVASEPWPRGPYAPGRVRCPECGGSGDGKAKIECTECKGTGTVECPDCRQDTDCDDCDGTGKVLGECAHCGGKGKVTDACGILLLPKVDGFGVRGDIGRRIGALPGVVWGPAEYPPDAAKPIPFWFAGGGQGLVMMCERDAKAAE